MVSILSILKIMFLKLWDIIQCESPPEEAKVQVGFWLRDMPACAANPQLPSSSSPRSPPEFSLRSAPRKENSGQNKKHEECSGVGKCVLYLKVRRSNFDVTGKVSMSGVEATTWVQQRPQLIIVLSPWCMKFQRVPMCWIVQSDHGAISISTRDGADRSTRHRPRNWDHWR